MLTIIHFTNGDNKVETGAVFIYILTQWHPVTRPQNVQVQQQM